MLVHGPFSVTLLLTVVNSQLARHEAVEIFEYRNFRPLYVGEEMRVCVRRVGVAERGKGRWEVWIEGVDEGIAVRGTVVTGFREKESGEEKSAAKL